MNIYELIQHQEQLNKETLPQLSELVEKYPFFQTARLLYLENLYKLHHADFKEELSHNSAMVPDCSAIFWLTEGDNYINDFSTVQCTNAIQTEEDSNNRTISLIDNFLSTQSEAESKQTIPHSIPTITDVTTDYTSFLLLQESEEQKSQSADGHNTELRGLHLINTFIEETKGKQRYEIQEDEYEETTDTSMPTEQTVDLYNENIAQIYIKQGKYQQAFEIFQKICLNNPEKKPNFAGRMQMLEEILNQDNKKEIPTI